MKKSTAKGKSQSKKRKSPKDYLELFLPTGIRSHRKTEYDPAFHPADFVAHCREGNSVSYICASWGISSTTLYRWIDKYKEFGQSYLEGKTCRDAYWDNYAKLAMQGQIAVPKHGLGYFVWYSKNRLGWNDMGSDEFKITDKDDLTFTTPDGVLTAEGKLKR